VAILRAAEASGCALQEPTVAALVTWLATLRSWSARVNLTAASSDAELADIGVADALRLAHLVPQRARVVDVGTGAGAPGLALAILRSDLEITLVEPSTKRCAFLRTVLGATGVRAALVRGRGEAVAGDHDPWDLAMSRATLPVPSWLEMGRRLVRRSGQGKVVAFVSLPHTEVQVPGLRSASAIDYEWPSTGAKRGIRVYETE
jgi:16S rRNA (guanine527-N7)-methyltransferase